MDHLKSALQFLTLLPLGKSETFDTRGMTPYFPLAGIIVGVLVSIFDKNFCGELKSAVYTRLQYMHKRMTCVCLVPANQTLQSGLFGGKMLPCDFIPTC